MKKNNIIIASLLILLISIQGCSEDEVIYDTPNGFIQVNTAAGTKAENDATPIVTKVLLGKGSNENGVTVSFQVNSSDPSRYSIIPSSGQVTIPAGEFSADISLTAIDNSVADGDIDVEIVLLESDGLPVGVGGEGVFLTKRVITIIDDDCSFEINDWAGDYGVVEVITGGPNAGLALAVAFGEFYELKMSLEPGDTTGTRMVITNNGNEFLPNGTVLTFNEENFTIALEPSPVVVALFTNFTVTSSVFFTCSNTIIANGNLGATRTYEFVLTKR